MMVLPRVLQVLIGPKLGLSLSVGRDIIMFLVSRFVTMEIAIVRKLTLVEF